MKPSSSKTKIDVGVWKIFDCEKHKAQGHDICFGINDATIYGFPILVPAKKKIDKSKLKPFYTLGDNEAFVILGRTPPPCLYWGFTPYLHKRMYENESEYTQVNASLSDTLNHRKFQKMFQLTSPFEQPVMIIVGKNPTLNNIIYNRRYFEKLKLSTDVFNKVVIPLPADIMRPDDLITIISRVTYIKPDVAESYIEKPGLFCFKFTLNVNPIFLQQPLYKFAPPVPPPDLQTPNPPNFFQITRDTSINEGLISVYSASNKTIRDILQRYIQKSAQLGRRRVPVKLFSVTLNEPRFPIDLGLTCIENRYDCFFDNRDTVYSVTTPIITTDAPHGIYVTGVNHVNTGKAIYTNINIYDAQQYTPVFDLLVTPQPPAPMFEKNGVFVTVKEYFYMLFIPFKFYQNLHKIFIAERAYLQNVISSSFDTIAFPLVYLQ